MQVFRYFLLCIQPAAENIIRAVARKTNVSSLRAEWRAQPAPVTWVGQQGA
jgi:hypothetical protein